MSPKPSAAAMIRSTSYSVRRNVKSLPSHVAHAARVSPSSGMPAEPGLTSSLSFAPRRRNWMCECPNTSVRPVSGPTRNSSAGCSSRAKLSTSLHQQPCT